MKNKESVDIFSDEFTSDLKKISERIFGDSDGDGVISFEEVVDQVKSDHFDFFSNFPTPVEYFKDKHGITLKSAAKLSSRVGIFGKSRGNISIMNANLYTKEQVFLRIEEAKSAPL